MIKREGKRVIDFRILMAIAIGFTLSTSPIAAQHYKFLQSQSETEQVRILRSVINSAGYPCSNVTTILFKGSDRDDAGYWGVACSDGGNWMVAVDNDVGGTTNVTPCGILKLVNVDCWEKF